MTGRGLQTIELSILADAARLRLAAPIAASIDRWRRLAISPCEYTGSPREIGDC